MNQPPRVLLLIPHLGGGGAERVFALLAGGLSRQKYELHLGLATQGAPAAEALPPGLRTGVTIHALGARRVRFAAFRLLALVRRLRPQVIVSGMYHLSFLVLLLRPLFPRSTRIVARQNGTVSAVLDSGRVAPYTRLLYRVLYRRADRILCQSPEMAEDLVHAAGLDPTRLAVVRNPVDVDAIRTAAALGPSLWAGPGPHLLAVGRLSKEKGFDLLLTALATVRAGLPDADLVIAGTGPEESALRAQQRVLGLDSAVCFAGHVDDPAAWFAGATVFVLSSRHEGMPNALLEAAAAGLPIVALPAAGGMKSLLSGQPGAWVAAEASASALTECLLEALDALPPGRRFPHPFLEPFRMERALAAYEVVLDQTLADAGAAAPARSPIAGTEGPP